jgi:hypothetical protein
VLLSGTVGRQGGRGEGRHLPHAVERMGRGRRRLWAIRGKETDEGLGFGVSWAERVLLTHIPGGLSDESFWGRGD